MKVLYCGDVVGKTGRKVVTALVPELRQRLDLDFVVVNGENAAHGFGLTGEICEEFFAAGVDVVTTGNHVWDQRDIIPYIGRETRVLRPLNYPEGTPGIGAHIYSNGNGARLMVLQVMGRLFMDPLDDPFAAAEKALQNQRLGASVDCIIADIHAEATSEKVALGHVLDGRVSLVVGTHSHVPTADARILPGGTAFMTDVGMCGDYDSVIGMQKEAAIARFVSKMPAGRLQPATGPATLCAVYVETDNATGQAIQVGPLRVGGSLAPQWPLA